VSGQIVDLNGNPLSQAMVTLEKGAQQPGVTAITVFSDEHGHFRFPVPGVQGGGPPSVKLLGYKTVDTISKPSGEALDLTVIMRPDPNEAGVAPASAWLKDIANPSDRTLLVQTCVGCHQIPAPEVRAYANLIHDMPNADPAEAREKSWHAIVQYMNYISAWEFGRGGDAPPPNADNVYSGGPLESTTALLARTMPGSFGEVSGYQYGAPLLANAHTVIREYAVPRPNAVREALTLDDPTVIWMSDVSANRVIRVDTVTGTTRALEVPSARLMGPHTLVRDKQGELWITPFFNGIVARLDPKTEHWKTWPLEVPKLGPVGVHDLSFDVNHDLLTDRAGRIWFSEIVHNGVGWFDPQSGKSQVYPIPPVPGRVGTELPYGLAMSSDRRHIWYSQLNIGCIGSFDIDTKKFETLIELPDKNAGPRRIAMSDRDILYVPLYGAGQLIEYDTRAHQMIGTYDLPDRASAPYSVTWDAKRKVLWVVTANANAIYRFDPRDKSFAVLPLPREGAFLRMVGIDKTTGQLITTYGNIVEYVHGPRMAVMIDPGDAPAAGMGQTAAASARQIAN
jgi:virginiamycin B lyase